MLVISPIDGGSYGISRHAADALVELGAQTEFLDLAWLAGPDTHRLVSPAIRASAVAHAGQLIVESVRRFQPDVCFILAQAPVNPGLLDALRAAGTLVGYWFVENYHVTTYWRSLAPSVDFFFTLQDGVLHTELLQLGCPHVEWLPLACNPTRHRRWEGEQDAQYTADVSFAGYGYYNRQRLFTGLKDYDLKIWGPGFEHSGVADRIQNDHSEYDEETWLRIASGGRIHVNLHSATHVAGVDPLGDYLNPRTFELASCRAFQVVDRRTDLERMFPDSSIPSFGSLRELRELIHHYLHHPDERAACIEAAWHRVLTEHTYRHRMQSVLASMVPHSSRANRKRPSNKQPLDDQTQRLRLLEQDPVMNNEEILLRLISGESIHGGDATTTAGPV